MLSAEMMLLILLSSVHLSNQNFPMMPPRPEATAKPEGCDPVFQFDCIEGKQRCIPPSWVCDNFEDCVNGRDEWNCKYKRECPRNTVGCKDGSFCIPRFSKCDGVHTCYGGTEEVGCDGMDIEHLRQPDPTFWENVMAVPWGWIILSLLVLLGVLMFIARKAWFHEHPQRRRRQPPPPIRLVRNAPSSNVDDAVHEPRPLVQKV